MSVATNYRQYGTRGNVRQGMMYKQGNGRYDVGAEGACREGTQDSGATMAKMKHQELLKGLIRLHILHHASKAEFYGQWMIHELARHGYTLSPGTLYPMLHSLERRGYLKSKAKRLGRTFRRVYRATALGKEANKIAKIQVRELTGGGG